MSRDGVADDLLEVDVRRSVVISPSTITVPVVVAVSQATRACGIVVQDRVQDRVGDLVAHLVRMTLGHRSRT